MTKRPVVCPICGSKVVKVTNAVTKNSYFKCSNDGCMFVLGEEYTDAEFHLQGQLLKTTCLKCHKPLMVINGPHGLYPRCSNCTCDFEPTLYNGKMYSRWVNAHRNSAKEEVKELIKVFNTQKEEVKVEDTLYDFEAFVASTPVKELPSPDKSKRRRNKSNSIKILEFLKSDMSIPRRPSDICKKAGVNSESIQSALSYLMKDGLIRIVKCSPNTQGNFHSYYQITQSNLPELKIYHKEDGYNSVTAFLKKNGISIIHNHRLIETLKNRGIEPVLFNSSRGICYGYKITDMKEALNGNSTKKSEVKVEVKTSETPVNSKALQKQIVELMQNYISKSYSADDLSKVLKVDKWSVHWAIRKLKESKKIRIVDCAVSSEHGGPLSMKYQLVESPLPKLKVTTNKSAYMTISQFYDKKLRGKRSMPLNRASQEVKKLQGIPLLIKNKAYMGYAVSDLKEIFKDYIGAPVKTSYKETATSIPVEVEAAVIASQNKVSNPIAKKKSLLGTITSFFKKEKAHS
jgi:transcription initiation factor IIE alpha subunit